MQTREDLEPAARTADDVDARRPVDLVEARGQLAHGDEDRARHVRLGELRALADVEDRKSVV